VGARQRAVAACGCRAAARAACVTQIAGDVAIACALLLLQQT
jgi:hypothetical protein